MKKNGILTFLFAFVPGAGQMYQGYMKRGLSLITLFFLCIMAGMLLLEQLVLTALIVWMYSFFDTFNLRAQFIAGTAPADDYLVHFNTKDARPCSSATATSWWAGPSLHWAQWWLTRTSSCGCWGM